jgi:hypothetical protein
MIIQIEINRKYKIIEHASHQPICLALLFQLPFNRYLLIQHDCCESDGSNLARTIQLNFGNKINNSNKEQSNKMFMCDALILSNQQQKSASYVRLSRVWCSNSSSYQEDITRFKIDVVIVGRPRAQEQKQLAYFFGIIF